MKKKSIYFLSLGCPRNLVDSEVMLGALERSGFEVVEKIEEAHIAIINTCSFIQDAVEEAIETILDIARYKKTSGLKKIILCGCFVQRFGDELIEKLPEVDAFIGTNEILKIKEVIDKVLNGERVFCCFKEKDFIYQKKHPRYLLTPKYTAYLKISEGCYQNCSYCVIPKLRGRYRSRSISDIVAEAESLARKGCKEFNIIGQDTTSYGIDLYKKKSLDKLLKKLARVKGVEWIRLLYTHPAAFTRSLIDVIANSKKICKYVDVPVQHISPRILKKMNRPCVKKDITALIKNLRESIKDVCLRTTLMVGFPGEEEKDFQELLEFMKWAKFERLGIFEYSKEDGVPAASFDRQVPASVKKRRFRQASELQKQIAGRINQKFLGKTLKVIIDEVKDGYSIGRSEFDAPEVDGLVYVYGGEKLKPGNFVNVEITDTLEYDLVGQVQK